MVSNGQRQGSLTSTLSNFQEISCHNFDISQQRQKLHQVVAILFNFATNKPTGTF